MGLIFRLLHQKGCAEGARNLHLPVRCSLLNAKLFQGTLACSQMRISNLHVQPCDRQRFAGWVLAAA